MKRILGVSAFYYDSAAVLVVGEKVIAAAQKECFIRDKHINNFAQNAIRYCLDEAGLHIDELDAVVFYEKPLLNFERLLETYYVFSSRGLTSVLRVILVWLKEKMFLMRKIRQDLFEIEPYKQEKLNLVFSERYLSHAASTFFASDFDKSAIFVIDGVS